MALTPFRDPQFDSEDFQVSRKRYQRTYRVGHKATLASVDLEPGDTLPENASAEIITSWMETRNNMRLARVVAVEWNQA